MEILTSVKLLYICFKSLVNDFVYSFGRAALLLLVEVENHTVPVRERRRIRVNITKTSDFIPVENFMSTQDISDSAVCYSVDNRGIVVHKFLKKFVCF